MTRHPLIHLGYELGGGGPVEIPLGHMVVTGQTQAAGKTTTLEALVARSDVSALAFVTKRGEQAFQDGRRVQPYFRDRADWQFVTSIIDATLQEKNKFLRPWIMKICRSTRSLADVQLEVRKALKKATGLNEGVYTQLDEYLNLIVPEIQRARLARSLELKRGLNVMDLGGFSTPMQMLFVQSALDWVNANETNTVVVIPEAWEFVPEGKGSPVKASAIALVRKGAGIRNFIWVDSQDTAGVDKTILRGCAVWLIGVQREANEIKRNLANIPASIKKPSAAAVATLGIGQFYACWGSHAVKTYVQPAWMDLVDAEAVANGDGRVIAKYVHGRREQMVQTTSVDVQADGIHMETESHVNEKEAAELRAENEQLRQRNEDLRRRINALEEVTTSAFEAGAGAANHGGATSVPFGAAQTHTRATASPSGDGAALDGSVLYQLFRERLLQEEPAALLQVLQSRPEIEVHVQREIIRVDGRSLRGRIARLIADGFFEKAHTSADILAEIEKRGASRPSNIELGTELKELCEMGFFTRENKWYSLVSGMSVNVVEAA